MPKTARYISCLINNIERNFETATSLKEVLNSKNVHLLNTHLQQGRGTYFDVFEDDMAVTRTVVTSSWDGDGREFLELDIVATQFTRQDRPEILSLLKQKYEDRIVSAQKNGGRTHPLSEVDLT